MPFFFSCGAAAQRGPWPPHSWGFLIIHNDASQSVGLLWTSDQLVAETSTWQHTTIHAPGGIRTHDLSRRAAAELRLRPRGHWDRHITTIDVWCSDIDIPKPSISSRCVTPCRLLYSYYPSFVGSWYLRPRSATVPYVCSETCVNVSRIHLAYARKTWNLTSVHSVILLIMKGERFNFSLFKSISKPKNVRLNKQ